LPVRYWVPKEGVPYYGHCVAVLANAPHPNAARLLINHMLDTESQSSCANSGSAPSVNGIVERMSKPFKTVLGSKLMGTQSVDPEVSAVTTAQSLNVYGK